MKPKECKQCKRMFTPTGSIQPVCSPRCAILYVQAKKVKSRLRVAKAYDRRTAQLKKQHTSNDLPHQKKLTQTVFNKMRALEEKKWFSDRGLKPTCISCNKMNMDFCCGHFKTVASQGNLRYDRMNTYLQCNKYCNSSKSGNIEGDKTTRGYKKGLLERFGEKEGNKIIEYCETHNEVKKWTCVELIKLRKQFAKTVRDLENEN